MFKSISYQFHCYCPDLMNQHFHFLQGSVAHTSTLQESLVQRQAPSTSPLDSCRMYTTTPMPTLRSLTMSPNYFVNLQTLKKRKRATSHPVFGLIVFFFFTEKRYMKERHPHPSRRQPGGCVSPNQKKSKPKVS